MLSDDDGDISINFEREEQRKKQASEARRHLNDHARTLGGETPENIHPLLPQPLFASSFDSPRSSVGSAPASPTPPTESKVPNRPDVVYSKPRREYKFVRSRSSSSNLSSPSSSPPRSPRRSAGKTYRYRSEKDEAAQLVMLDRMIRENPEQSAPMKRVRDELLREREQHRYAGESPELQPALIVKPARAPRISARRSGTSSWTTGKRLMKLSKHDEKRYAHSLHTNCSEANVIVQAPTPPSKA